MHAQVRISFLCAAIIWGMPATAAGPGYGNMSGRYQVYAGGLGDPISSTKSDAKIAFVIEGPAALQMFDAIGPDAKDLCTEGTGIRVRTKDNQNLVCTRSAKGSYSCRFGFDLKSGKSIGGSLC